MTHPKKKMGLFMLTALVSGNMIGSGIFMLPANLAAYGTISLFSWIFTGLGALLLALVFSRLSLFYPHKSGGPYAYTYQGFGDFAGFQSGYCYWVNTWVGNAAIALVCVGYLGVFFPLLIAKPLYTTITSIIIIWILTFMNTLSIRIIGGFQLLTTILKIFPLLAVILFGWEYFHPQHLVENFNISGQSNFSALTASSSIALWAFIGLESATVVAEAVDNPEKNIPLATIIGTLIALTIYIICSTFIMSMIPAPILQHSTAPFADAAKVIFGAWGPAVMSVAAVIACLGTLNGLILLQGQVSMAKADDNLFPKLFGIRNSKGLPAKGQYITAILISLLLLMTITPQLAEQFQFIALVATVMAVISFFYTCLASLIILSKHNENISFFNKDILIAIGAAFYSLWAFAGSGKPVVFWSAMFLLFSNFLFAWGVFHRQHKKRGATATL